MNIAILNYHRIGGSGIIAYEIGRSMAEDRGHTVHFVGLEPPFRLHYRYSDRMRHHKIAVKEYPVFDYQPYTLALASQLSELITEQNIDVIHSHYALPYAIAAQLAREISGRNVRSVTTLHGTDITVVGAHPTMKNITEFGINISDRVTAVSDYLKNETVKTFGIAPEKIKRIYNFINPEWFHPEIEGAKGLNCKDKCIIIHVSNMRPVKAPLDDIRIFHRLLSKTKKELELWIVGEGPMISEMTSLVREYELEKKVRFLGVCSDIGELLVRSKLFLLPSQSESFGLVALEAMACGVPVVAAGTGGIPEVIEDGESGSLFAFGDIETAACKGAELLNDDLHYMRIRENGLETIRTKFDMNTIISEYEKLYMD
jgi:N-acetyl-alpha-D-glucosaminyl L-malate synthase BshA